MDPARPDIGYYYFQLLLAQEALLKGAILLNQAMRSVKIQE